MISDLLKKLFTILTLAGLLLQTFSQAVIWAEFRVNQDYIAKNLCENRDKPEMHCDGQCCLKRKLAKDGKEQRPSQSNQKNELTVSLFYQESYFGIKLLYCKRPQQFYFSYNELATFSFHHSVFHPPSVT